MSVGVANPHNLFIFSQPLTIRHASEPTKVVPLAFFTMYKQISKSCIRSHSLVKLFQVFNFVHVILELVHSGLNIAHVHACRHY